MAETEKEDNTPCTNLLCIADLEGCLKEQITKDNTTGQNITTAQNITMCQKETFNAISEYLKGEGNHVAFLGDYFDKGPHMVSSINGIAGLKDVHKDKVHIILGNRDLNKMRINIEKNMKETKYTDEVWADWKNALEQGVPPGVYEKDETSANIDENNETSANIDENNETSASLGENHETSEDLALKRTKYLLAKTYGAPELLKFLSIELSKEDLLYTNEKPNEEEINRQNEAQKKALDLFGDIFSASTAYKNNDEESTKFVNSCRILFNEGKLMEKVTVGEKNVLLSHGGSFNAHIFDEKNVHMDTDKNKPADFEKADYYGKMELCRKELERDDTDEGNQTEDIDTIIRNYNKFYQTVLKNVKDKSHDETVKDHNYHMLQAMGLKLPTKPENRTKGKTKYFVSPIESCILNGGCNGNEQIKEMPDKLNTYLKDDSKIDIISHGHIPFCGTVPLIYKNKDIIFVSNDVSNGNRPGYDGVDTKLENIPLSCISKDKVGICSLNSSGKLNEATNKIIGAYKNSIKGEEIADKDYYRGLVKSYDSYNNIPEYTYINTFFDTKAPYQPMGKIPGADAAPGADKSVPVMEISNKPESVEVRPDQDANTQEEQLTETTNNGDGITDPGDVNGNGNVVTAPAAVHKQISPLQRHGAQDSIKMEISDKPDPVTRISDKQMRGILGQVERLRPKDGGKAKSRKGRRTKKGKKGNRKTKKSRKSKRSKRSKKSKK
jgi:hypothetical protein